MPGKRLFLCSFIYLSVLEYPLLLMGSMLGGGEDMVSYFKGLANLFIKDLPSL